MTTWRITVVSDDDNYPEGRTEAAGKFVGPLDDLKDFAKAMKPWGLVVASPMEPDQP